MSARIAAVATYLIAHDALNPESAREIREMLRHLYDTVGHPVLHEHPEIYRWDSVETALVKSYNKEWYQVRPVLYLQFASRLEYLTEISATARLESRAERYQVYQRLAESAMPLTSIYPEHRGTLRSRIVEEERTRLFMEMSMTALALEEARRLHGAYPNSLATLSDLPKDAMTLSYRNEGGAYHLEGILPAIDPSESPAKIRWIRDTTKVNTS